MLKIIFGCFKICLKYIFIRGLMHEGHEGRGNNGNEGKMTTMDSAMGDQAQQQNARQDSFQQGGNFYFKNPSASTNYIKQQSNYNDGGDGDEGFMYKSNPARAKYQEQFYDKGPSSRGVLIKIVNRHVIKKVNIVVKHHGFLAFCFALLGVVGFFSLVSYSALDESFNVVSSYPVSNYMGRFGAYFADFFLQYFGLAAYFMPPWCLFIAYELFSDKKIFVSIRLIFFVLFIFCTSFLLCYLQSYKYYFEYILGGYIASELFFAKIQNSSTKLWMFLANCPLMVLCFMVAAGFISVKKYLIFIGNIIFKIANFLSFGHLSHHCQDSVKVRHHKAKNNNETISQVLQTELHFNQGLNQELSQDPTEDGDVFNDIKPKHIDEIVNPAPVSKRLFAKKKASIQYNAPLAEFLTQPLNSQGAKTEQNIEFAKQVKNMLIVCLKDFGVSGVVKSIQVGPVISLFEFEPEAGIRAARVIGLSDDIARYLKVPSCRITLIAARGTIGIEIPNIQRETVFLREVIDSPNYQSSKFLLPITFGKTIEGEMFVSDLAKMPHLLIAGTTGSGKSVGVNAIILSILYRLSPQECRFIMIDPKMLELSVYEGIPHLLSSVVTDPKNAVLALKWVLEEMERRYTAMARLGVRNIIGYNERVMELDKTQGTELEKLPYIVVIVDEMADLMVVSGKAVEISIQRISQMARAAGIHLILATQRPSVDVITGVIKANMPTRVSFQVTSSIDSRTIIGGNGAEKLLGMGDMIFVPAGLQGMRMHAPFVADSEVSKIVEYIKQNNAPTEMLDFFGTQEDFSSEEKSFTSSRSGDDYIPKGSIGMVDNDEFNKLLGIDTPKKSEQEDKRLYKEALKIVFDEKRTSISYIQRKLRIGFNKAASIMDQMQHDGYLSAPDDKGKRIINESLKPNFD